MIETVEKHTLLAAKHPMDAVYEVLAALYIRRQAKQLGKQLPGVCHAEDTEYIHRARVASRRLRAALRVFGDCFGKRTLQRWRRHIRRLARQLGDARDADVQIQFLCGFLSQPLEPSVCRGLSRLLAELERRRERLQPRVARAVKVLRRSGVLEEMLSRTKKVLDRANNADADGATPEALVQFARHIRIRLDEFLALQDSLQEPDDAERLHSLRIAAKRLRYTLEIARSANQGNLQPFIEAAKGLQTLLGEIHDCDVWQAELESFQAAQRKRMLRIYGSDRPMAQIEPGIELLRQDRCRRRQELVQQVTAFWQQLEQQGTWQALLKLLEELSSLPAAVPVDTETSIARVVAPADDGAPVCQPAVCDSIEPNGAKGLKVRGDGGRQLPPESTLAEAAAAAKHQAQDLMPPHARRKRAAAVNSAN